MIFHFTLKLYELFKMFQTCVSLSRYTHICSNHLWRSENNDTRCEPQHSSDRIHQYVLFPVSQLLAPCSGERRFSHLAHEAPFASTKWFIIKWFPKVHQYGVSSCALHRYDLNGSATNKLHYHYQLCIFWLQHYEYVYHYYRDSSKIDHSSKVHDHKRYYSYK